MKHKLLLPFLLLVLIFSEVKATHVVGGVLEYTRLGPGTLPNSSRYKVTLRLWRDADGNPWFPINPMIECRGDTLGYTSAGFDPYSSVAMGINPFTTNAGIGRMVDRGQGGWVGRALPQFIRDFRIACGSPLDTMTIRPGALSSTNSNNNTRILPSSQLPTYENPGYDWTRRNYPAAQYNANGFGYTTGVCNAAGASLGANASKFPSYTEACIGGRQCIQPNVVDSCTIVPTVIIQYASYTRVIELPNIPGGYHLWYRLCCRNLALLNVVDPNGTAFAVYGRIPDIAQLDNSQYTGAVPTITGFFSTNTIPTTTTTSTVTTTTGPVRVTTGPATTLTSPVVTSTGPVLTTTSNSFTTTSALVNQAGSVSTITSTLRTITSSITTVTSSVISVVGFVRTITGTSKFITTNRTTITSINITLTGIITTTSAVANAPSSLREVYRTLSTTAGLSYTVNLTTTGVSNYTTTSVPISTTTGPPVGIINKVSNSAPRYKGNPPLFICQYNSAVQALGINQNAVFDHSAVDPDGDSLVYQMSTPFDADDFSNVTTAPFTGTWNGGIVNINGSVFNPGDALFATTLAGAPPYPRSVNLATFNQAVFTAGKTFSTPMSTTPGFGPALQLNSVTGALDMRPWNLNIPVGLYVVNIRTREFRRGTGEFLGEIARDYQFRVLSCPLPARAAIGISLGSVNACNTLNVNVPNNSTPAAFVANLFYWDFGRDRYTITGGNLQQRLSPTNVILSGPQAANTTTLATPLFNYQQPGSYYTKLVIMDRGTKCSDSVYQVVNVSSLRAGFTQVPNGSICVRNQITYDPYNTASVAGFITISGTSLWTNPATNPIPKMVVTSFNGVTSVTSILNYKWMPLASTGRQLPLPQDTIPPGPAERSKVVSMQWDFGDGTIQNLTLTSFNSITGIHTFGPAGGVQPNVTILGPNALAGNLGWPRVLYTFPNPGTYNIKLTIQNQFGCIGTYTTTSVVVQNRPTATGIGGNVCVNNPIVTITGTLSGPAGISGGIWSGGAGTYLPFANMSNLGSNLSLTYRPSAAENVPGNTVFFNLETRGLYVCPNGTFTGIPVLINPSPYVEAGPAGTVCGNNLIYTLNGVVTGTGTAGAFTAFWRRSTRHGWASPGKFQSSNTVTSNNLSDSYLFSKNDSLNGSVTLVLVSQNNGICSLVSDSITISVLPASALPKALAGLDQSVCSNNSRVNLSGSVQNSPGGIWTRIGSGGFGSGNTSNSSTLSGTNAFYTPSAADAAAGSVRLLLSTTIPVSNGSCNNVTDTMIVTVLPPPSAVVQLNLSSPTICANNPVVTAFATITGATGLVWSMINVIPGTYGTGTYSPTSVSPNLVTLPGLNRFRSSVTYTLSTLDLTTSITGISKTFEITTTGNLNGCNSITSRSSNVFPLAAPQVTIAGAPNAFVCKNGPPFPLSFSATNTFAGINTISWQRSGTGTFTPSSSNATPIYNYTAADAASGTVNIFVYYTRTLDNCLAVGDTLTLNFTNPPTVSGGNTVLVCENNLKAQLNGSVTAPATGGIWNNQGSSGKFTSTITGGTTSTILSDFYFPTATELANGFVMLTLSATGPAIGTNPGQCSPVASTMMISFTGIPQIFLGNVPIICQNNPTLNLNASVIGPNISLATRSYWSGGLGTYNPSPNNFSVVNTSQGLVSAGATSYTPTIPEISSLSVPLTISTTGLGACADIQLSTTIGIAPRPTATILTKNITVCGNNASFNLSATVTGATGGTWSGGMNPVNTSGAGFSATYIPSSTEINNGSVKLFFTTQGVANNCSNVTDSVLVTITPAPIVQTSGSISVCGTNLAVTITGSVQNAGIGVWSTSGTGSFSNRTIPGAAGFVTRVYNASLADTASPTPTYLTLTSGQNGNCTAVFDRINLSFGKSPVASAGLDQTVCLNNLPIQLSAGGNAGAWTVRTTVSALYTAGTFVNAGNNTTSTIYTENYNPPLSLPDKTVLTFEWKTNPLGVCASVSDFVNVTVLSAPVMTITTSSPVCGSNGSFRVGLISGGSISSATLTTSGSGRFQSTGASFSLLPTVTGALFEDVYIMSAADILSGVVTISASAVGNPICNAVIVSQTISIEPVIQANAGPNRLICSENGTVPLFTEILRNGVPATIPGLTFGWLSSIPGVGIINNSNNSYNASFTKTPTDPQFSGTVPFTLTPNSFNGCPSRAANVFLTFVAAPTATITSAPIEVCSDTAYIQLTGTVTGAAGMVWVTSGTGGSFSPSVNVSNPKYIPSASDRSAGIVRFAILTTGTGLCTAVSSGVRSVDITAKPTLTGGGNMTICGNNPSVLLSGSQLIVINTSFPNPTVAWGLSNTIAPIGTIVPSNSISSIINGVASGTTPTYTPSTKERTLDKLVTVFVTVGGLGSCKSQVASRQLTFTDPPTIDVGAATQSYCGDISLVTVTATLTNATSGAWSITTPLFGQPTCIGVNCLTATYSPPAAMNRNINNNVDFLYTVTVAGCLPVTANKTIIFTSVPGVSLTGVNPTVCGDALFVTLNGQAANGFGKWSTTATGAFAPNNSNLPTVQFSLNATDKLNAYTNNTPILITLSSDLNGICASRAVVAQVTIIRPPAIYAGSDTTVCTDVTQIPLSGGMLTVSSGMTWSSPVASGTFTGSNAATLTGTVTNISANPLISNINTALFNPSSVALAAAGPLMFTAASTGSPAGCNNVFDSRIVSFVNAPTINSLADQTICFQAQNAPCNAVTTNANGIRWISSGNGSFLDPNSFNTTYFPTPQDSIVCGFGGVITITASVIGNNLCRPVFQSFRLRINPYPVVNAGTDLTICADTAGVILSNTTINLTTSGVIWSNVTNPTNTGTNFFPNNTTLRPTFRLRPSDIANGKVALLVQGTSIGSCRPTSDTLYINILSVPTITGGADRSVCSDFGNQVKLTFAGIGFTTGQWTSSGDGNFCAPSCFNTPRMQDTAVYNLGAQDIANKRFTLNVRSLDQGLCKSVNDNVTVTITSAPVLNAGNNRALCYQGAGLTISLSGAVVGTESYNYIWYRKDLLSTSPGSFLSSGGAQYGLQQLMSNPALPGTDTYTTGPQENPSINFIFSVIGNNVCNSRDYTDTFQVSFQKRIDLSIILPVTSVCSDVASFNISVNDNKTGFASDSTFSPTRGNGIVWSVINNSGKQANFSQYNPSVFATNIDFTLSQQDKTTTGVTFSYTTTGNGLCPADIKSATLPIYQAPTINTMSGITVCSNNQNVNFSATVSNATSNIWRSSSASPGIFQPLNLSTFSGTSGTYIPSTNEVSDGATILILTASRPGCADVSQPLNVTIKQAPTVNAGVSSQVCALAPISISGTIAPKLSNVNTGTPGTLWSIVSVAGGSASLLNANDVYSIVTTPSTILTSKNVITINSGVGTSVTLRLTATEPSCAPVSGFVTYDFTTTPVLDPGTYGPICNSDPIVLAPGATSSAGNWTTTGLGSFASTGTKTTSKMDDVYNPALGEFGPINFTLLGVPTSCGTPANAAVTITLTSGLVIKAAQRQVISVCANVSPALSGTVTGTSLARWEILGTGYFSSTSTSGSNVTTVNGIAIGINTSTGQTIYQMNETYIPSQSDKNAGRVVLRLTAIPSVTGPGSCQNVAVDTLSIFFTPPPSVSSGGNKNVCANVAITTAPGGGVSFAGTAFLPSPNSPDPFATPINAAVWSIIGGSGTFLSTGTKSSTIVSVGGFALNTTIGINDVFIADPTDTITANQPVRIILQTLYVGSLSNFIQCNNDIDTVNVNFSKAPGAQITSTFAGLCNDQTQIQLDGRVSVALGGVWSTSGTGSLSPDSVFRSSVPLTYNLSASDLAITSPRNILFNLKTTNNFSCFPTVSPVVTVTILPRPNVSIGSDQIVCSDLSSLTLSGTNNNTFAGVTNYRWFTNGTGSISGLAALPSTSLPGVYGITASDINFGNIQFTLSTSGPNTCRPIVQSMNVTIRPKPILTQPFRQELCKDPINDTIRLSTTPTNASGVTWLQPRLCIGGVCTTLGDGLYASNGANAAYLLGAVLDRGAAVDSLMFIASTTGSSFATSPSCNDVTVTTYVKLTPAPTISTTSLFSNICATTGFVDLTGNITVALGGQWSSSGDGSFSSSRFVSAPFPNTVRYVLSASELATPVTQMVNLVLSTSGSGSCKTKTSTTVITITGRPYVFAGDDRSICSDDITVPLTAAGINNPNSTIPGGAGVVVRSFGTGTFVGTNTNTTTIVGNVYNDVYVRSAADSAGGSVIFEFSNGGPNPCGIGATKDYVTVSFDRTPNVIVSAGLDQIVCADNNIVNLNGVVVNGQNYFWTAFKDVTVPGNSFYGGGDPRQSRGKFDNINDLNTTYRPSWPNTAAGIYFSEDTLGASGIVAPNLTPRNQVVRVQLSAYGVAACRNKIYTSNMRVTFTSTPKIVASVIPSSICTNDTKEITLTGTFINSVAGGAIWQTSGSGQFKPGPTVLNSVLGSGLYAYATTAFYRPSATDKSTIGRTPSIVTLSLITQGNGSCQPNRKEAPFVVYPKPVVSPGPDLTICETQSLVSLSGSTIDVRQGQWYSSGSGRFGSSSTIPGLSKGTTSGSSLRTVDDNYTPSALDKSAGKVNLFLWSTQQANGCPPDTQRIALNFDKLPIVNAGLDQSICSSTNVISLSGSVQNSSAVIWTVSTPGSGSFSPSANTTVTSYALSANDRSQKKLVFTMSSNSLTSKCPVQTSAPLNVFINQPPTGNIASISICTINGIPLSGTIRNALFGTWSTSGTGSFAPTNAPTPTWDSTGIKYYPSATELSNEQNITLTINLTPLAGCSPVSVPYKLQLKKNPLPVVNAGPDAIICQNSNYELNAKGLVSNYSYQWFAVTSVPSLLTIAGANQTKATVFASTKDSLYILQAIDNVLGCINYDSVIVKTILPPVYQLLPQNVCYNDTLSLPVILLDLSITGSGGKFQWYKDSVFENGQTNPSHIKVVSTGVYQLEYTKFGCTTSAGAFVRPSPNVFTKGRLVCREDQIYIKPTFLTATGVDTTTYITNWFNPENTVLGIYFPNNPERYTLPGHNITISKESVKFPFSVRDKDFGCTIYDTIRVGTHPKPLMQVKDNPACIGDIVSLDARPINLRTPLTVTYFPVNRPAEVFNATYKWTVTPGTIKSPRDTNHIILITTPGLYMAKFQIGECIATATSNVVFNAIPTVTNESLLKYCSDDNKGIVLDAGTVEGQNLTYLWLASGNTKQKEIVYDTLMYYFKIFNAGGCNVLDSIKVTAGCDPKLFVPGAFIPDGDDERDKNLLIFGKYYKNFRIRVYDRWGVVIFASDDPAIPWDGKHQKSGAKMPMGVYPVVVEYESIYTNKKYEYRSGVQLIR
ncbi:MAG: gliding motility-associated C-terminal domain-containing protein [Bacteroidota bacterium]|nr:gliding motility-associated C-terminal domain-containing protein [Bacteroidota bacterium]